LNFPIDADKTYDESFVHLFLENSVESKINISEILLKNSSKVKKFILDVIQSPKVSSNYQFNADKSDIFSRQSLSDRRHFFASSNFEVQSQQINKKNYLADA
jgi:hypothetical protein